MTMTPEEIYRNFHDGSSGPLRGTADQVRTMVTAYREVADHLAAMRGRMTGAWTGDAAHAATGRTDPLATSLHDSADLLDACARSHDAQTAAFDTAQIHVREMPPVPARPDPLQAVKDILVHGPTAPFDQVADYRAALVAHEEAAKHNLDVLNAYDRATTDNQDIPTGYPNPVLPTRDGMGQDPVVSTAEFADDEYDPTSGGIGDPGGGTTSQGGGGVGGPGGGGTGLPGGGLGGGSGSLDLPPAGVTAASDAGPGVPTVHSQPPPIRIHEPPPTRFEVPGPPPRLPGGPGGHDDSKDPKGWRDDWTGTTQAAHAGGQTTSGLGWPLGGGVDRTGGDAALGGQLGRGGGGPGSAGGGAGGTPVPSGGPLGARGGVRGGGPGGVGMGPAGSSRREEDKEHTRPEYLIEPDPNEIFGGGESASSPVIGASWRPEYGEETDD